MEKFQSPRRKKINSALQKEIAYLLQGIIRKENITNLMISVTKINVSPDLSSAKVYLSIFPNDNIQDYLNSLNDNCNRIKHDLSQKMKNQLFKIPKLSFYIDDSLNYIEKIEKELKTGSNPLRESD
tara:strand:+ start:14 stop:391 length:378 start_codon:yes stop_codon:yes gene_type:complete